MKFDTTSTLLAGVPRTAHMARKILEASQWFAITPYPDDEYMVEVKIENRLMLLKFAQEVWGYE